MLHMLSRVDGSQLSQGCLGDQEDDEEDGNRGSGGWWTTLLIIQEAPGLET